LDYAKCSFKYFKCLLPGALFAFFFFTAAGRSNKRPEKSGRNALSLHPSAALHTHQRGNEQIELGAACIDRAELRDSAAEATLGNIINCALAIEPLIVFGGIPHRDTLWFEAKSKVDINHSLFFKPTSKKMAENYQECEISRILIQFFSLFP
jgi:hypothetical protein